MKKAASVLFVILATSALAMSQTEIGSTAGELRDYCKAEGKSNLSSKEIMEYGLCLGYIRGLLNAIPNFVMFTEDGKLHSSELQAHVTVAQAMHVFVNYLNQHPEEENESLFTGVVNALMSTKLLIIRPFDLTKLKGVVVAK